ncbi:MAG: hypothetical protein QXG36_07530 [Nitrososphaeria archaeon]
MVLAFIAFVLGFLVLVTILASNGRYNTLSSLFVIFGSLVVLGSLLVESLLYGLFFVNELSCKYLVASSTTQPIVGGEVTTNTIESRCLLDPVDSNNYIRGVLYPYVTTGFTFLVQLPAFIHIIALPFIYLGGGVVVVSLLYSLYEYVKERGEKQND